MSSSYPQLVLRSGRDRSVLKRHPWVFSGAIKERPKGCGEGDIVAVADNHGQVLAYGFYAPNSQIIARLFHFGPQAAPFNEVNYWQQKLVNSQAIRQQLLAGTATNCYRLVHAEGDFFPGLIADVYHNVVVVQLLTKATEQRHQLIVAALQGLGFEHVYFKGKTSSKYIENITTASGWLAGQGPTQLQVTEHGIPFLVDVAQGQKTGFFIDQRENRLLLGKLSGGKSVLNTFCYTGGFSVYALKGGARRVVSVDISKTAIALCNETVAHSYPEGAEHEAVVADCFDYLRAMEEAFDVIVLDPPAFAKNARSVPNASRGYKDLNLLAFKKVAPGGLVMTYSCSQNITPDLFRKIVFGAAADAGRDVRIIQQLHQPEDHPINIYHPEGEYLKGLLLHVS